jgi:hypothetical protein
MAVPFPVDPPLSKEDAVAIADVTRPKLGRDEHISFVEPLRCPTDGCGEGIDLRAQAIVKQMDSDLAEVIFLCKRRGRWFATRLGEKEDPQNGCPGSERWPTNRR